MRPVMDRQRGRVVSGSGSARKGVLGSVTWTVVAEDSDVVVVNGQALDEAGNEMAEACSFPVYLSSDAAGQVPLTTGPDGDIAIGTDGAYVPYVSAISGLAITEADGDIDFDVEDAGAFTSYLNAVMPDGTIVTSAVLTHSA